jgi:hypothetical protein
MADYSVFCPYISVCYGQRFQIEGNGFPVALFPLELWGLLIVLTGKRKSQGYYGIAPEDGKLFIWGGVPVSQKRNENA